MLVALGVWSLIPVSYFLAQCELLAQVKHTSASQTFSKTKSAMDAGVASTNRTVPAREAAFAAEMSAQTPMGKFLAEKARKEAAEKEAAASK